MTLFWHPAGLKISYDGDAFKEWMTIEDLNPHQKITFKVTHWELLRLGFRCIWAAIQP